MIYKLNHKLLLHRKYGRNEHSKEKRSERKGGQERKDECSGEAQDGQRDRVQVPGRGLNHLLYLLFQVHIG